MTSGQENHKNQDLQSWAQWGKRGTQVQFGLLKAKPRFQEGKRYPPGDVQFEKQPRVIIWRQAGEAN